MFLPPDQQPNPYGNMLHMMAALAAAHVASGGQGFGSAPAEGFGPTIPPPIPPHLGPQYGVPPDRPMMHPLGQNLPPWGAPPIHPYMHPLGPVPQGQSPGPQSIRALLYGAAVNQRRKRRTRLAY